MAVMTLFHGMLSDAVGRRPIILGGLALYVAASVSALFASNFSFLLLCRLVQGMFAGAGMVVGRAMIRDRFPGPEAQMVMSYTTVVFGLAPVVAPILGGWLEVVFGWRSVFGFLSAFGFLLLAACTLKLPESLPAAKRSPLHLRTTLKNYLTMATDGRFLFQSVAIALAASALFIYISAAPVFVLKILGLSETSFAWLFIPMITGIMLGSLAAGRVAHFWRAERTIQVGFGMMIGAAILNVLYAAFFTVAIPWARYSDSPLHLWHGVRLSSNDDCDTRPLSRTARYGRLPPVRVCYGPVLDLLWSGGAFPFWKCAQARSGSPHWLSRQRGALGLWAAAVSRRPSPLGDSELTFR